MFRARRVSARSLRPVPVPARIRIRWVAPIGRARATSVLLAASLAAGCYGGGTSPSPGGATEILSELARGGVRIESAVAGDAGCDDPSLADNATHLRVSLPPDQDVHDLYLFTFKGASYDAEATLVDACLAALPVSSSTAIARVDVPPYRAYGIAWSDALREAVRRALMAASRAAP
jgi:hypothetical protein